MANHEIPRDCDYSCVCVSGTNVDEEHWHTAELVKNLKKNYDEGVGGSFSFGAIVVGHLESLALDYRSGDMTTYELLNAINDLNRQAYERVLEAKLKQEIKTVEGLDVCHLRDS